MRPALVVLLAATCVSLSPLPASAQGIVFDPSVFGRQFEQLTEMKRQFEALSSQLKVAQDQLGQAKQLYDSLNKLTSVNDVASLLNSAEFRRYLPNGFAEIEGLIKGSGSGSFASSIESYLGQNRLLHRECRKLVLRV